MGTITARIGRNTTIPARSPAADRIVGNTSTVAQKPTLQAFWNPLCSTFLKFKLRNRSIRTQQVSIVAADVFFARYALREKNNLTIDRSRHGYGARLTADEDKRSTSLRRKHNRIAPTRLRAVKNAEATKPSANL